MAHVCPLLDWNPSLHLQQWHSLGTPKNDSFSWTLALYFHRKRKLLPNLRKPRPQHLSRPQKTRRQTRQILLHRNAHVYRPCLLERAPRPPRQPHHTLCRRLPQIPAHLPPTTNQNWRRISTLFRRLPPKTPRHRPKSLSLLRLSLSHIPHRSLHHAKNRPPATSTHP